jgi:coenzyme F420 biosynthesis associated uncharacterized protein
MPLVDWDLATSTAARLGPTGPSVTMSEAAAAVADLRIRAEQATEHVAAYTRLVQQLTDEPVAVVDRKTWAAENVAGLRTVLGPLADKLAPKIGNVAGAVGSKVAGVQAGTLLAYLSGKVLGQYEVFGNNPGKLLLVAPNVVAIERKLGVDPRDFRLWVSIHEVTHRTQFTAVPWLRDHFVAEIHAFVAASEPSRQIWQQAGKMLDAARGKDGVSLLDAMQTPEQKAILDRLTCIMTLLEGHAEVVMDGVGPAVIPSVSRIRAAFDRRRATANPLEQYLRRLLGVDLKLKQYTQGRAFVAKVIDTVGMDGFNRIFDSPQTLPRLDELSSPQSWVDRVAA